MVLLRGFKREEIPRGKFFAYLTSQEEEFQIAPDPSDILLLDHVLAATGCNWIS
jgi:hypothetical protein